MQTQNSTIPRVDTRLAKFSQASVFVLSGLAFVFNQPILVLITAILMIWSVIAPAVSPFKLVYQGIFVRLRLLSPRIVEDDPAPHRFAQGIGAAFLTGATLVFFLLHIPVAGWVLDLIVFVLSGINFFVGFCAGCFVYYHLGRLGVLPSVRYEGDFHWRGV